MPKRSHEEGGGVNLGIIVTPMLDMAFQLLAFFVMTYHPSATEGHYKLEQVLPPERPKDKAGFKGEKKEDKLIPPEDPDPKLSDALLDTIKSPTPDQGRRGEVKNREEGQIWRIILKRPEGPPETIVDTDEFRLKGETKEEIRKELDKWDDKCLQALGKELKKIKD